MIPRYPVYVPSRDRWQDERRLTVKALAADGVPFRVVVVPSEADAYMDAVGARRVLVLPSDDMILRDSRNWIRDHAESEGHARHWQLDDNLLCCYRLWEGRRVPVHFGVALRVCEDLSDRFTNVAISGLNYDMFVIPFGSSGLQAPFFRNVHVYSASLVNHAAPYRWRLIFNDDTDICLQALVGGWTTLLVNAFTAKKLTTMTVNGGNTDGLYRDGAEATRDTVGRFEMARVLERTWPGLVTLSRRYGRYQHSVDWTRFRTPLRLRDDLDLAALPEVDEYGLALRAVRPVKSPRIRELHERYEETLATVPLADELWRGLPAFRAIPRPPKLTVVFDTKADRDALVDQLGVTVDKKYEDKAWAAWYPPRGRDDPASLRFEPMETA